MNDSHQSSTSIFALSRQSARVGHYYLSAVLAHTKQDHDKKGKRAGCCTTACCDTQRTPRPDRTQRRTPPHVRKQISHYNVRCVLAMSLIVSPDSVCLLERLTCNVTHRTHPEPARLGSGMVGTRGMRGSHREWVRDGVSNTSPTHRVCTLHARLQASTAHEPIMLSTHVPAVSPPSEPQQGTVAAR